ncbi:MAG: hypothetical protein DYG89_04025 [Caldilinea sp. CFX5]|nr:hypothetical protein [Caldilinea sp. CFX5]
MNADFNQPVLPFAIWIAAVDLLCLEAWHVDAYTIGPQPWELWHENGWTPERAVMELSTPTVREPAGRDIEDLVWLLNQPTIASNSAFLMRTFSSRCAHRRIMHTDDHLFAMPELPPSEVIEIALRYLDIQEAVAYPPATREQKIRALERLGITVQPDQHPLTAWTLAMCRENGLPEQRPSILIGEAAQELCPKWVWWLA